jgi:hypothetical protein
VFVDVSKGMSIHGKILIPTLSLQSLHQGLPNYNKETADISGTKLETESARVASNEWTQYFDEDYGVPYWYNETTGESKWTEDYIVDVPGDSRIWERHYDDEGNAFYYNNVRSFASI